MDQDREVPKSRNKIEQQTELYCSNSLFFTQRFVPSHIPYEYDVIPSHHHHIKLFSTELPYRMQTTITTVQPN
jgi:hypothetical protein